MKRVMLLFLCLYVVLFCAGCGGGGGSAAPAPPTGPSVNLSGFFLYSSGNVWHYTGRRTADGQTNNYFCSTRVNGTKLVNGTQTTVVTMDNVLNSGTTNEQYYRKTVDGIYNYGNNDPGDIISPHIVPYAEMLFPAQVGAILAPARSSGIDSGEDLDGDGINERLSVTSSVKIAGFEAIALPVGVFPSAARIEGTIVLTLTLSASGIAVQGIQSEIIHLAEGVGVIRKATTISTPVTGETASYIEELNGYLVGGRGKGIVAEETLAAGVAPANSDAESPGRPAVAFDGNNYLVVSRRVTDTTDSATGAIVSPAGQVITSFDIVAPGSNRYGLIFGAGTYLVAFSRFGQIAAFRVTPAGVVLDGTNGIVVSAASPGISNILPAIAFDGSNFLVVWAQFTGQYDIQGALVTPAGDVLKQFTVFAGPGEQVEPTVAFDGTNYLVAWRDTRSGVGPAADTDIYATRVSPEGTVLDPTGFAITTAPGVQGSPQLLFGAGQYLAVWVTASNNPPSTTINATRINPDGTLPDGPPSLGGLAIYTTSNTIGMPTIAPLGNNYLVAWEISGFDASSGIFGALLGVDGQLRPLATGDAVFPMTLPAETATRNIYPVAAAGGDRCLVVWMANRELLGTTKDLMGTLIYPFE